MADNSASDPGALDGKVVETPEFVSKAELNATINGFRKALKEDFAKQVLELKASLPVESETKASKKQEVDPEKQAILAELKKLTEERSQERQVAQGLKLKETLGETLISAGVDPKHLKHAMAFLTHEGAVHTDEDGAFKMRLGHLDYDLQDGIKSWIKTDDAKLYLSPKGAVGSGQKGPTNSAGSNNSPMVGVTKSGMEADWSAFSKALLSGKK